MSDTLRDALEPINTVEYWAKVYSNADGGPHFEGHGMAAKLLREYAAFRRAALAAAEQPAAPLDWKLPYDVKIGNGTHRKGTSLATLVTRMQWVWLEAFGPPPSPEEQAENLANLCGSLPPRAADALRRQAPAAATADDMGVYQSIADNYSADRAPPGPAQPGAAPLMPAADLIALSSRYAEACDDMARQGLDGKEPLAYREALLRADAVHRQIAAAVNAVYGAVTAPLPAVPQPDASSGAQRAALRYDKLRSAGRCDNKHGRGFDVGTALKSKVSFRYWCDPVELDSLIDAAPTPATPGETT